MRQRESPCLRADFLCSRADFLCSRADFPACARISLLARGFPLLSHGFPLLLHKTGRTRLDISCSRSERVRALKTCLSSRSSVCARSNSVLCTCTSSVLCARLLIIFTPGLNVKSYQPIRFFYDNPMKILGLHEEGTDPGITLQFNNI